MYNNGVSIQGLKDRIKLLLGEDAIFYTVVVLLVAIASFGLGRWSSLESAQNRTAPIVIRTQQASLPTAIKDSAKVTETTSETLTPEPAVVIQKSFVGSKKSDKYHLPWCSGAKRIKEENKIWFATKADAESAGYIPAANCKGL